MRKSGAELKKAPRRCSSSEETRVRTLQPTCCVSDAREVGTSCERQVFVDESDRHAALTHSAGYPLDRTVTDVARAKYAGKARLQWKRLAIERPPRQVSPS